MIETERETDTRNGGRGHPTRHTFLINNNFLNSVSVKYYYKDYKSLLTRSVFILYSRIYINI